MVVPFLTSDFNAGYNPRLFLGDFTADSVDDIKLSIDSGGSGGYGYFYIYTYINNTPKEIFNFNQYNALYQYKVDYIDLYRVVVHNMNHDKLFVLDVSYKGNEYISQYYDEFGMLIMPIQGDVLAINALMPLIQNEEVNAYELLAYQRIIGPINSDTLGYVENVLSWDGKEFVSTRMSAGIPGLLLNPPVE
ncbi:MAG: VCBS repeat-containing protein [Herbinix sp.]|nr:VCBS repeat-containing protein [Herbinix sp.]